MKNIFKAIILGAGVVSAASCSDFLDQTSPSEITTQTACESAENANLILNKVYGELTKGETYTQYVSMHWATNSDIELIDGLGEGNVSNTTSERGNMNYNANPGWGNLSKGWNAMYSAIEYANMLVDGVNSSSAAGGNSDEAVALRRYRAEAKVLRAMVYLDLTRVFGDIPFKLNATSPENVYLGKTDRDDIYDALISDVEGAIDDLPWAGDNGLTTEHANKGFAHAVVAQLCLTRAGWAIREQAKSGYETAAENSDAKYPTQRCDESTRKAMYQKAGEHLAAIINSGKHKLNPSFADEWYKVNQRELDTQYQENIFEIPDGLGKSSELGYTIGVRINGASTAFGAKGNSSGKVKLTAPFFWSFDKKDQRRDITCATYEMKEENGILKENMQGNKPFEIYVGKWDVRKMNEEWRSVALNAGNAKWMSGINVIRMRYSQVLLMYAEVANYLNGNPDAGVAGCSLTAREALGQVHTRAFAEADKVNAQSYVNNLTADNFFSAIVDEDAWELAGEGFRKFDLIRWNLLSSKIDEFKASYTNAVKAGNVYPKKLYFKYNKVSKDDSRYGCEWWQIDMSSVQWYAEPEDVETGGWESVTFWGDEDVNKSDKQKNINTYLPFISAGLNSTVKNRYLLPIGSTTISESNGSLHNSYGYSD